VNGVAPTTWNLRNHTLDLSTPRILAVLNITPDSFSDGGEITSTTNAVEHARRALADGADMLDIGGESTRPGAEAVSPNEQIARTIPVINAIRNAGIEAPISIDTTSAEVAQAALDAGANAVNDVSAGTGDDSMLQLAAHTDAGIILMHRSALPVEDVYSTEYQHTPNFGQQGVVHAVATYLDVRAQAAISAGIPRNAIVIDPGLGFGKSVEQNLQLIAQTNTFTALGYPVLAASSRKSFIGAITDVERPKDRLHGSTAAAAIQVLNGASIVRCHDINAHAHTLQTINAIRHAIENTANNPNKAEPDRAT